MKTHVVRLVYGDNVIAVQFSELAAPETVLVEYRIVFEPGLFKNAFKWFVKRFQQATESARER